MSNTEDARLPFESTQKDIADALESIAGNIPSYEYLLNVNRRTRRNITADLTNLSAAIAEQDLAKYGYAIGDYFVGASGYYYYLAHPDFCYGGYTNNAVVNVHNIGIVVDTKTNSKWADSMPSDGYSASTLHELLSGTVLNNIKSDIATLFGNWEQHLISHSKLYAKIGSWGWSASQYISALTESQVYGAPILSVDNYQQGEACEQLELFRKFKWNEIFGNIYIWLRSIASSSNACNANDGGFAFSFSVSYSRRAAGLIMFH